MQEVGMIKRKRDPRGNGRRRKPSNAIDLPQLAAGKGTWSWALAAQERTASVGRAPHVQIDARKIEREHDAELDASRDVFWALGAWGGVSNQYIQLAFFAFGSWISFGLSSVRFTRSVRGRGFREMGKAGGRKVHVKGHGGKRILVYALSPPCAGIRRICLDLEIGISNTC